MTSLARKCLLALSFFVSALSGCGLSHAHAQDTQNLYMAGGSYSAGATPAVAGTALYAHHISDSAFYGFTMIDALPNTTKPFTVTTNVGAGVAVRVLAIGTVPIFMPTSAGISYTSNNVGWSWTTGAGAAIQVKPNWYIMPTVRVLKSSVANGTGYQPIIGILFGYGK